MPESIQRGETGTFPGTRTALSAVVLLAVCVAIAFGQQTTGHVLISIGNWTLEGRQDPLSPGTAVSSGARVQNANPNDDDRIVLIDSTGALYEVKCRRGVCNQCGPSGSCQDEVGTWRAGQPKSDWLAATQLTLQSAWELLHGKENRYSIHRSRGASGSDFVDGVVPLEGHRVELKLIFANQPKGTYNLELTSLSEQTETPWQSGRFLFNWDPAQPLPAVTVAGLSPGLYRLQLFDERGSTFRVSQADAWLLLSSPSNRGALSVTFEQARKRTDEWPGDIEPEIKRAYLRAVLEAESQALTNDIRDVKH